MLILTHSAEVNGMRLLDRGIVYTGIWLAVILSIVALINTRKLETLLATPAGSKAGTTMTVHVENQPANATSCYVDNAWISVKSTNDTWYWKTSLPNITLTFATGVFVDDTGNQINSPLTLPANTPMGPYNLSQAKISSCTGGKADDCYISYDVLSGGNSCEDHGAMYFTGVQVTR